MQRLAVMFLLLFPLPAQAQVVNYIAGACAVLDANDSALDYDPCHRLADDCTPDSCILRFGWLASGGITVVESGTSRLRDGFRINGVEAQAPAALVQSDARECVWNAETQRTFCWEPGAEAMARATGPDGFDASVPDMDAPESANTKVSPLLAQFEGLYRPAIGTWSCRADQIGMEGGALAVAGNRLMGVESLCLLTRPVPVGGTWAIHVQASCSAEGDSYAEDLILHRTPVGLTVLRSGAASHLLTCS